jgi:hypothetical protein
MYYFIGFTQFPDFWANKFFKVKIFKKITPVTTSESFGTEGVQDYLCTP